MSVFSAVWRGMFIEMPAMKRISPVGAAWPSVSGDSDNGNVAPTGAATLLTENYKHLAPTALTTTQDTAVSPKKPSSCVVSESGAKVSAVIDRRYRSCG